MSKHAEKAKVERIRKDTTEGVTKTTKGFINLSMGNAVRVSSTAATLYTIAKLTGTDKKIADVSKTTINKGINIINDYIHKGVY